MFYLILVIALLYWFTLATLGYKTLLKTFKKYQNISRTILPQRYNAFLRMDFGRWNQKAMLRRAFTHFPLRLTAIISSLTTYGIMGVIHTYCKFPPYHVINLFRKMFGKFSIKLILNIKQDFNTKEKIQTPICIANHSTFMDILYFGFCQESIISFVSKKQIQKLPIIRDIAAFLQSILVDRSSVQARARVKIDISQRVQKFKKTENKVFPLLIFPQGTVSNGRSLMQFKNGAFQPLSPITIFSLRYQSKQFHMGDNQLSFLQHIIMSLMVDCDLKVTKKLVKPNPEETIEKYRERCRKQLSLMGDYKIYEATYKDSIDYYKSLG